MTQGPRPGSVDLNMERPKVLPLPGNSQKETNFNQPQPGSSPGVEWPGVDDLRDTGLPTGKDPSPFKTGGR